MTAQTTLVPAGSGRALGVLQSKLRDIDQIQHNTGGELGYYGVAPVTQRASSLQATSNISGISTGAVSTNSILLNTVLEIMNTLNGLGLWKGAA